jgi:N-acetylglucosaminyl-diphospho-decaprenol L-rhamnosyltransferase
VKWGQGHSVDVEGVVGLYRMARVSVVILNYNTRELLREAVCSVETGATLHEVVLYVVDNASTDGSDTMIATDFPHVHLIKSPQNDGFASGNNLALHHILSEPPSDDHFIMLLNPDAVVTPGAIDLLIEYLKQHPRVGAVGPRVILPDGSLDAACRRSFPTPEVSFYRMTGLARLFPHSRRFGRYNLTYLDPALETEVDSLVGAAMVVRESVVREIGLLDEAFFMYGEDLDWCFRIKSYGWQIMYYPAAIVYHHKRAASTKRAIPSIRAFYDAMRIFHRKHYAQRTLTPLNVMIEAGITAKEAWALARNSLRSPQRRKVN